MTRTMPALAVFFLVTGAGLVALLVPLPLPARILLVIAGGFVSTGALLTLSAHAAQGAEEIHAPPTPLRQPVTAVEISPTLRHDLRGILSPAVLCADQLTLSPDETTRTRAGQILDALDRATDRLKAART
ncbi:hypothetical protein [Acetobacter conturbans]|uniref:Uncharacterized protein n=1 Tax=Acetobacter conturbans TaxID=1737472 RepID=A0ABX0JWI9_9PROT|nr:hypothetical protein [Acetobacter conturbans]NHN87856.1 hypothetical protein [Acetobacter conturbans]